MRICQIFSTNKLFLDVLGVYILQNTMGGGMKTEGVEKKIKKGKRKKEKKDLKTA